MLVSLRNGAATGGGALLVSTSERRITVNGREITVGTIKEAARLCVSDMSPNGVTSHTYVHHLQRQGAPGPIYVPDPWPEVGSQPRMVRLRDQDGRELRDMDAVRRWNAARTVRPGNFGPGTLDTIRRTPQRVAVLRDARDGHLRKDAAGHVVLDALRATPRTRVGRTVSELTEIGALTGPDTDGVVTLSGDGVRLLARFERDLSDDSRRE